MVTTQYIDFPTFDIPIDDIASTLDGILIANKTQLKYLLAEKKVTWHNLVHPLEMMEMRLHHFWSIVTHLNAVKNNPMWRKVYTPCLLKVNQYKNDLLHNQQLYHAIKSIHRTQFKKLNSAKKAVIEQYLLDFKLSGATLPLLKRKQLKKLSSELATLTNTFSENVLDATHAWHKQITTAKPLAGIPEYALSAARKRAKDKKQDGFILTLDMPCYIAVMVYAKSRPLREEMYTAFITRASDQGPLAEKWNNGPVMVEILKKRLKLATLLKFKQYAAYSLAPKMAKNTTQVLKFLNDLVKASLPQAKKEFEQIKQAALADGIVDIKPWDIAYYSEILRKKHYDISQEALRPYFPAEQVLAGLFKILKKLFSITLSPLKDVDVWHECVQAYTVHDENKKLLGLVYLDLYTRCEKRGGAWMDECRSRQIIQKGEIQLPIAFVNCNFQPPVKKHPALLSHDDVLTLFHEFGHALQHLLTEINYSEVSGINGIPWDAVEISSQFLENYAWQKSCLNLISGHYQTGKKLPQKLFNRLARAKNFQSALQMCRQLEFSLFDFRLHMEFNPRIKNQIQKILNSVREKVSVTPQVPFNRFQNGFAHIFSGGYAAGYYSYKWSEMMSADIFSLFKRRGIFDQRTCERYKNTFLSKGASLDVSVLFKRLMKREPNIKALLEEENII
jgi:oligopeptidase A